jgi:hypothetical protein
MSRVITFRRLDLNHIGAEIGEGLPDPGAGQDASQFDDFQSSQGSAHTTP